MYVYQCLVFFIFLNDELRDLVCSLIISKLPRLYVFKYGLYTLANDLNTTLVPPITPTMATTIHTSNENPVMVLKLRWIVNRLVVVVENGS